MNRRQRRAAGFRTKVDELQHLAACPDCGSEVEIERVAGRIYNATVRHDDTCPWLTAFQRDGGLGVRFVRRDDP
ncbi:hypothetical protein [Mycolicibacterium sp.]|uniref:hypothetical protein n=1 Tax=Mycolicibacterium sp. TaxID=2320850 RepID=UPI001A34B7D7|nr:hypothetical protein [Mycolicibacterium sp.]MBJ7340636.1 hypothetical protein [Mycolicibacterium sp.]